MRSPSYHVWLLMTNLEIVDHVNITRNSPSAPKNGPALWIPRSWAVAFQKTHCWLLLHVIFFRTKCDPEMSAINKIVNLYNVVQILGLTHCWHCSCPLKHSKQCRVTCSQPVRGHFSSKQGFSGGRKTSFSKQSPAIQLSLIPSLLYQLVQRGFDHFQMVEHFSRTHQQA